MACKLKGERASAQIGFLRQLEIIGALSALKTKEREDSAHTHTHNLSRRRSPSLIAKAHTMAGKIHSRALGLAMPQSHMHANS